MHSILYLCYQYVLISAAINLKKMRAENTFYYETEHVFRNPPVHTHVYGCVYYRVSRFAAGDLC